MRRILLICAFAVLVIPAAARAQLQAGVYVSGLVHPLGFVQDPSDPSTQYIVEQEGRIRVVRSGGLLPAPFLDLSGAISTGGERGLLGLAFPRDYAASGRFFVDFTDPSGNTVVARFRRSQSDPLTADPASRFDLRWSSGERVIRQPFSNHNGGDIVFGPDGFLYIGMGDGGGGDDPNHNAQDPASLLGKMLRIDVNVADADPEGFDVPADNPFAATAGTAPEIWSFGLRNPWRFSFDDPARGGTGALVIADVGQGQWEEIDYEPASRGGRNYGWRNREGAHDHVTSLPPAFQPLVDPVFEYDHSTGQSISGGYVYRGTALGAASNGRYFFADFVAGRVWSLALSIDPDTGDATAGDLREHTTELGGSGVLGLVSTFGVDAQDELYVVSWSRGIVFRIAPGARPPAPLGFIDVPRAGERLRQPFSVAGWALDTNAAAGSGVDTVHVWAYPLSGAGGEPLFLGASTGFPRPDVAAAFGPQFGTAGFGVRGVGLPPGPYRVVAFAHLVATGEFDAVGTVDVTVEGGALLVIDIPAAEASVARPFRIAGWAADPAARSGTGVDAIHVWAYPVAAGPPTLVGIADYGGVRPDVGVYLGDQYAASGYSLTVTGLPPGLWDVVVFAHSTVSGTFDAAQIVRLTVQ